MQMSLLICINITPGRLQPAPTSKPSAATKASCCLQQRAYEAFAVAQLKVAFVLTVLFGCQMLQVLCMLPCSSTLTLLVAACSPPPPSPPPPRC